MTQSFYIAPEMNANKNRECENYAREPYRREQRDKSETIVRCTGPARYILNYREKHADMKEERAVSGGRYVSRAAPST